MNTATIDALRKIAAELGLVQTGGTQSGEGYIRRLLEAIAAGDMEVVPKRRASSEAEPIEKVLEAMALAGIIEPGEYNYEFQHVTPVELEGPLLSQQIIVERR